VTQDRTTADKVSRLVENLGAGWNGGQAVLHRLMKSATDAPTPFAAFRRLERDGRLDEIFTGRAASDLEEAVRGLEEYLSARTWMDSAARTDARLRSMRSRPIAYFCAEFGLEAWLPIYSGGLGVLAGDVVKEAGDLGIPLVALGLFYRRGFFNQELDGTGYQHEVYPTLSPDSLPLSPAKDRLGAELVVEVPVAERMVRARVWELHVGRVSLYLLDTDTPENQSSEDRDITARLYGGDADTRIRQELVLGIGGVRALRALGIEPSVYSMNEGHAAFLGLELLLDDRESTGAIGHFADALDETRERIVYTNHTVVPAGNDIFSPDLVLHYLAPYTESRGLPASELLSLGGEDSFSMAILAFHLSAKANAVSHIHAEAIRSEPAWSRFPVVPVTNGVHIPTWLGPEMADLLDRHIPGWRDEETDWEGIDGIPPEELWDVRTQQRRAMTEAVNQRVGAGLSHSTLTVVWARRFAQYKRAGLLAKDIERLAAIMSDDQRPVQLIISGKAHPRDEGGKRMLQELLHQLRSHPDIGPRFAFVPNYNIEIAHALVQGTDVWLNTPRKPLEASGTSGMKSSDNGGLQLTVKDGWAAEVEWYGVGWGLEGYDDDADAGMLYEYLEKSIGPIFYDRDPSGVPLQWVSMMKRTMKISLSRFSARRMVLEYLEKLYLPLLEAQEAVRR
jgi:glycogen phosphorylase